MASPVERVLDELCVRDLLALVAGVAARRGVLLADLCGNTRTQSVSRARQEAWWCIRQHPERSYSLFEIARIFERHHATVHAGIAAHQRRLDRDKTSSEI